MKLAIPGILALTLSLLTNAKAAPPSAPITSAGLDDRGQADVLKVTTDSISSWTDLVSKILNAGAQTVCAKYSQAEIDCRRYSEAFLEDFKEGRIDPNGINPNAISLDLAVNQANEVIKEFDDRKKKCDEAKFFENPVEKEKSCRLLTCNLSAVRLRSCLEVSAKGAQEVLRRMQAAQRPSL